MSVHTPPADGGFECIVPGLLGTAPVNGVIPPYRPDKLLGSGHSGRAYRVTRLADGAVLAAKVVEFRSDPEDKFNIRAKSEATALATCAQFNICRLIDVHYSGEVLLLLLEYCDALDLASEIQRRRRIRTGNAEFPEESVGCIVLQIALALRYLHCTGHIVHRDVKSANVLCNGNGVVKLADFGFAKNLDLHADGEKLTFCGTPLYMAPEIWAKGTSRKYDFKADMWSLGVVMYELLTLQPPFNGDGSQLKAAIQRGDYQLPANVSRECRACLASLLTVNPTERVSSTDLFRPGSFLLRFVRPLVNLLERAGFDRSTVDGLLHEIDAAMADAAASAPLVGRDLSVASPAEATTPNGKSDLIRQGELGIYHRQAFVPVKVELRSDRLCWRAAQNSPTQSASHTSSASSSPGKIVYVLRLEEIEAVLPMDRRVAKGDNVFCVGGASRAYWFQCPGAEDLSSWLQSLQDALSHQADPSTSNDAASHTV